MDLQKRTLVMIKFIRNVKPFEKLDKSIISYRFHKPYNPDGIRTFSLYLYVPYIALLSIDFVYRKNNDV